MACINRKAIDNFWNLIIFMFHMKIDGALFAQRFCYFYRTFYLVQKKNIIIIYWWNFWFSRQTIRTKLVQSIGGIMQKQKTTTLRKIESNYSLVVSFFFSHQINTTVQYRGQLKWNQWSVHHFIWKAKSNSFIYWLILASFWMWSKIKIQILRHFRHFPVDWPMRYCRNF